MADPDNYVPPKEKFNRILNNKYATKVLIATKEPAKFAIDDMVQVRSTAGNRYDFELSKLRHRLCLVLNNSMPVTSAVVGAKRYKVFLAGDGYKILPDPETGDLAVEEPDHPFVSLTPIRMPHKFFGRALADLVVDVMKIKTVLWRQWLDNLYNINNARTIINDTIDMDDMLTNRVSSVVRMDRDGDVRAAAMPLAPQPIGTIIAPAMQFMDKVKEDRIGIPAVNQGLDPSALHDTATGINLVLGRAQKRILFIARTFAETGFKQAFKKMHAQ